MFSSFLIALREGAEAALVVGIVLVYLDRTGRSQLTRFVWAGVALAAALSLVTAIALERLRISEDGFEGVLMLLAAVFVVTMIVWMNRVARHLRKKIEQRVQFFAQKTDLAAGFGLATFVFLLVLREGAELALILRAMELSTQGLATWFGAGLGLALAVTVGFCFFEGTLKVPLGRFFSATNTILVIVTVQLALTGLHELSESMWIPSGKGEMALVGPIVRNEYFFFVLILSVAGLLILREWRALRMATAPESTNEADCRRVRWERRTQSRWMFTAAVVLLVVILTLTADFVYARASSAPPQARRVTAQNRQVHIPLSEVSDDKLHFFQAEANNTTFRFIVIRKPDGSWGTALDACMICRWAGYRQNGTDVVCRNCASATYVPSIGQPGGCNPMAFAALVGDGELVIDLSALIDAARKVPE